MDFRSIEYFESFRPRELRCAFSFQCAHAFCDPFKKICMLYNGAPGTPAAAGNPLADTWLVGGPLEKFSCSIVGIYSNCYMALDAKSGLVGENVMSEQFAAGLRLTNV